MNGWITDSATIRYRLINPQSPCFFYLEAPPKPLYSRSCWRLWQANIPYISIRFVYSLQILRCSSSDRNDNRFARFTDIPRRCWEPRCGSLLGTWTPPITGYVDSYTAHVSRKKGRSSIARLEAPMGSLRATLRHLRTFFSIWIRSAFYMDFLVVLAIFYLVVKEFRVRNVRLQYQGPPMRMRRRLL